MNIESLGGAAATAFAVASAVFGLWKQKQELFQKIERARDEEKERYAQSQKHQYGLERDLNHLKRDIEQLKQNLLELHSEGDRRLDQADRQISEISGALAIIKGMMRRDEIKN